MEWLCFRLELLSTFAFASSLVILVSAPEGVINPSESPPLFIVDFVLVQMHN